MNFFWLRIDNEHDPAMSPFWGTAVKLEALI